ncbi:hypothetical protein GQ53DRAFT_759887 [Thozetella sp. PMI_491]|nr:hypothetical protein GQ53DRAFT_759887 [Thozetella sp. PMI_491]
MNQIPSSSWDVHVHVFDPKRHPYIPNTRYTPPARSVVDLTSSLPTTNFVIVMSGPEGTNTALTVEAMNELRQAGREAKGVVVLDLEQMIPETLQALDNAGVRSVRFNTRRDGSSLDKLYEEAAERIHNSGVRWSIEAAIFDIGLWHSLIPTLRAVNKQYGTVFVADHVFAAHPSQADSPEFKQLLELVDEGILYVKISGLTRYGREPATMMPLVKEVLRKREGRGVVYGSDWPHVNSDPGSIALLEVNLPHHLSCLKQ